MGEPDTFGECDAREFQPKRIAQTPTKPSQHIAHARIVCLITSNELSSGTPNFNAFACNERYKRKLLQETIFLKVFTGLNQVYLDVWCHQSINGQT